MEKPEFIKKYRQPRILLGAFNDNVFLCRGDIELVEKNISVSELNNFYCPWYYLDGQEKSFDEGLCNITIKAMKVEASELIDTNQERRNLIEKYQREKQKLDFIPIATDTETNRTLILDSNKTCIALYRNYLENEIDFDVSVIEIKGVQLQSVIGDFLIINR